MKYTEKLNDPTPEQMADQCVPLEQQYEGFKDEWRNTPYEPTVAELVNYMVKHNIPSFAKVCYGACGSHTVELTW